MKNRIAIYCVAYRSYDALRDYLKSVEMAALKTKEAAEVSVFVADNTDDGVQDVDFPTEAVTLRVFPFHENLGYFGGIGRMMKEVRPDDFDFVIVSNVDLLLSADFFEKLTARHWAATTGWIAPRIYSEQEGRDKNPKILRRYSARSLRIHLALWSHPWLKRLYNLTLYRQKKFVQHEPGDIYAGHGSLIVLTGEYFRRCGAISYPVFLFCEEIYLAEECMKKGLTVTYAPELQVEDGEHVSTGKMSFGQYCRYNADAISYILKTYYPASE